MKYLIIFRAKSITRRNNEWMNECLTLSKQPNPILSKKRFVDFGSARRNRSAIQSSLEGERSQTNPCRKMRVSQSLMTHQLKRWTRQPILWSEPVKSYPGQVDIDSNPKAGHISTLVLALLSAFHPSSPVESQAWSDIPLLLGGYKMPPPDSKSI